MSATPSNPSGTTSEARVTHEVARGLARLRTGVRVLLVARALAWILAGAIAGVIVLAAADYVLRAPAWFRAVTLVAGLAVLTWEVRRHLLPALRFGPPLVELALRVEATEEGRRAGLVDRLAAGLELDRPEVGGLAGRFGLAAAAEAARRFGGASPLRLLRVAPAVRAVGWAALAAGIVGACGLAMPELTSIGIRRVVTPWVRADWPRRTEVADLTRLDVHPIGTALPIRAALLRSQWPAAETRVAVRYRLFVDGQAGPVRRAILTSQDRDVVAAVPAPEAEAGVVQRRGTLMERLIEPEAFAVAPPAGEGDARAELEYVLETSDHVTDARRVLLVEPPRVVDASAEVVLPEYARASAGGDGAARSGRIDLGAGNDERAAAGPVLAGSRVALAIRFNKPIPLPTGDAIGAAIGPDLSAAVAAGGDMRADGPTWTITWQAADTVRVPVQVADEHGIVSAEEAAFTLEVATDRPPVPTVIEPGSDMDVLPSAVVSVAGEARDDVALRWVALEQQAARRPDGSPGAPHEALASAVEFGRTASEAPVRELSVSGTVRLAELDVRDGDEVWLAAIGTDVYEDESGPRAPVRSPVRRLRVIGEQRFVEQVWSELAGVRRAALRIDEEQARLARENGAGERSERLARGQDAVTPSIQRQREIVERLGERVRRNALEDTELADVLREAASALEGASARSADAAGALGRAAEASESGDPEAASREATAGAGAQREVRLELERLAAVLERGQDVWAARRGIERLLEDQRGLREQTAEAAGGPREGTDAAPRAELARRQDELARQAEEALERLEQREQSVRDADPAAAQGLADAARRARRNGLSQRMQQAARQLEENQANNATAQQDAAIGALERMLQDIDEASRQRDRVLARALASLIESIEVLVEVQRRELDALVAAPGAGSPPPEGMMRLHRNTLGVADQAAQAGRDSAPVADQLQAAAAEQVEAVASLRASPARLEGARASETRSLELLGSALEEARRLRREAEERDAAQQREALRRRYQESLQQQTALREETVLAGDLDEGRRRRALARELGARQEALRGAIAEIRASTGGMETAEVFGLAHDQIDASLVGAASRLAEGVPGDGVTRRQDGAARVLRALISALEDKPQKDGNEFSTGGQGGAGQGAGGQQGQPELLPRLAELRLLRLMQGEALDATRASQASMDDAETLEAAGVLQRRIAEHAERLLERLAQPAGQPEPGAPPVDPPEEPGA